MADLPKVVVMSQWLLSRSYYKFIRYCFIKLYSVFISMTLVQQHKFPLMNENTIYVQYL
jgi:hypothetical protein